MPAVYAHYCFGARVAAQMDGELKQIITKYKPQYEVGLQGPDIFFFYRPVIKNRLNRYGYGLHKVSAYPFFRRALRVVRKYGRDSREYAYLLGFICHFTLDSECHSYVNEMIGQIGVEHLEIEAEFDKTLLRQDGFDAFSYPIADLVAADRETAAAIAPFYHPEIGEKRVLGSLKDLQRVKKLFTTPGAVHYHLINAFMKLTGTYAKSNGLMYQHTDNPACAVSNAGLQYRFDHAVLLAVRLMESFDESVRGGRPLEKRFARTFE